MYMLFTFKHTCSDFSEHGDDGLSTEKTVGCFPGSLLFSLQGIVGLCKPVMTLDRLTSRIFHWGPDPEAL